jgi:mannose-1-phosphate guanylyltransferase
VTVVVDRTQTQRARLQLAAYRGLELVEQPCDRGTAAGVLLPLLHVLARDPHATVLLAASDHGVADERTFVATLAAARRAVDDDPSRVVLIAAEPAAPNTDYGWIVRVGVDDDVEAVDAVERFVEKPLLADAEALFASGRALWNTMILVARGAALVDRMRERLPKLCRELESLVRGARRGAPIDVAAYQALPRASFSFDVLSGVAGLSVLALPSKAGWTDLGTETRLAAWLARRRRTPAEPMAQAG